MTNPDINAAIAAMHVELNGLVETMIQKGVFQPVAEFSVLSGGDVRLWLKSSPSEGSQMGYDGYKYIAGGSFAECMEKARVFLDKLPNPQDAANQRYLDGLARVVDTGRKDGVPDEWIAPVTNVVQAMTENLIAGPKK